MKRSFLALAVLAMAVVAGTVIYLAPSHHSPGPVNAARLLAAAKAYADDLRTQQLPVPASVSVRELISRNLLTESDVRGFSGLEVMVSLTADGSRPQDVLLRAQMPDGHEVVALADGSVQSR